MSHSSTLSVHRPSPGPADRRVLVPGRTATTSVGPGRPVHDHRARRGVEQVVAGRAEQEAPEPATAAGAHHDRPGCAGGLGQHAGGRSLADARVDPQPGVLAAQPLDQAVDHVLGGLLPCRLARAGSGLTRAPRRLRRCAPGGQDDQWRVVLTGQVGREPRSGRCGPRSRPPRRPPASPAPASTTFPSRTTTTGQCAWVHTVRATDPSRKPGSAPRPRSPRTSSWAPAEASTSAEDGPSKTGSALTSSPGGTGPRPVRSLVGGLGRLGHHGGRRWRRRPSHRLGRVAGVVVGEEDREGRAVVMGVGGGPVDRGHASRGAVVTDDDRPGRCSVHGSSGAVAAPARPTVGRRRGQAPEDKVPPRRAPRRIGMIGPH